MSANIGKVEQIGPGGTITRLYVNHPGEDLPGEVVLRDIESFLSRYVVLPRGAAFAVAAWIFLTHCFESFDVFPYLALTSPAPRCGKSTLLACIGELARNPIPAANISEAALFRTITEDKPTLLLDEMEWMKQKSERAQIMTNLLNAGHRCDATVIRVGQNAMRQKFSVFGPKAMSVIGDLTPTLADRSIRIALQRRTKDERVERFRFACVRRGAKPLQATIGKAIEKIKAAVAAAYEVLPDLEFLDDRAADNWSPLFALIGVLDPSRLAELRKCAQILSVSRSEDAEEDSLPLRLLGRLRGRGRT